PVPAFPSLFLKAAVPASITAGKTTRLLAYTDKGVRLDGLACFVAWSNQILSGFPAHDPGQHGGHDRDDSGSGNSVMACRLHGTGCQCLPDQAPEQDD